MSIWVSFAQKRVSYLRLKDLQNASNLWQLIFWEHEGWPQKKRWRGGGVFQDIWWRKLEKTMVSG
jgi:hypothetical protein